LKNYSVTRLLLFGFCGTHYPLLRNSIQRAAGPDVKLVDSGEALAETLKNELSLCKIKAGAGPGEVHVLMSDLSDAQKIWTETILAPIRIQSFQAITLG
jgi:glutamate racemase